METFHPSPRYTLVIGVILCLLVHSQGHRNPLFFTLYCQNMSLKVKGDQITLSLGRPTLFSLVTSQYYREDNSTNDENVSMSLEAVASGKFICMNKRGRVYSVDSQMNRGGGGRHPKKQRPPKNCLFKKLQFSTAYIYRDARAIFCPAHSNSSVGRFLSFSPDGKIRGVQRRYDALDTKDDDWVKLELAKTNTKMRNSYLKHTSFSKDNKFDAKVRKCIQREIPNLFPSVGAPHKKSRHGRSSGSRKVLKRIIPKCKRRIERKMRKGLIRLRMTLEEDQRVSNEVGVDLLDVEVNDGEDWDKKGQRSWVSGKNSQSRKKLEALHVT